jgi:hypothetical protein
MFKLMDVDAPVASHLGVTAPQSKDNLVGFFSFNAEAYADLVIPNLGALVNLLPVGGNIVALIAVIDQPRLGQSGNSLLQPVIGVLKRALENHKWLVFSNLGSIVRRAAAPNRVECERMIGKELQMFLGHGSAFPSSMFGAYPWSGPVLKH